MPAGRTKTRRDSKHRVLRRLDTLSDPMSKNITVGEMAERYICQDRGKDKHACQL